jgi:hypothetical protein
MSIIKATFETNTTTWSLSEVSPNANYIDLQINFVSDAEITVFNNLRFGYSLLKGEDVVKQEVFPIGGTIESARSTPVISERILVQSATEYTLDVWAENEGVRTDSIFTFSTPVPDQPFPSWTWNGTEWTAPIAIPTNGPADASYKWSEKQQKWFLLVPPLHAFDDI